MSTAVDVMSEQSFPAQKDPIQAWIVVFTASLFFFFEFMQINIFNAIDPALMREFHVNAETLGQISANYFYANILFLFVAGIILDRISTRNIIVAAMILSIISTYLFSFANHIWVIEVCRFVTGIGGAFCFLSSVRLATRWFPPQRLALVIGLIVTLAMVGGTVAQTPMTLLTDHYGWRHAVFIDATLGVLILVAIASVVRDYPLGQENLYVQQHKQLHIMGLRRTLIKALSNWQNWLGGIYTSLLNLPIFYEFIQMNMFNAISGVLMQDFNLDATELGKLSAYYFYANILFLFPAGMILDRLSTRKVILVALSICVAGTFAFSLSTSIVLASVFRFCTGIGSAFCFLSAIRLATRWFPANRMALVSGLIVTMAMAGGMVAQTPLTVLSDTLGWRHALMVDASLGLIIVLMVFLLVRDYPVERAQEHLQNREQLRLLGYWRTIRLSFLRRQNWLCGIYTSLLNLPIFLLGGIWGAQYLERVHHITDTHASYVTSMLFLGTIIGSPMMGWLSDRMGRRRRPMILGAIVSLITIWIIIVSTNLSFSGLLVIFLAIGFVTSTQIISYPLVTESYSKLLSATFYSSSI